MSLDSDTVYRGWSARGVVKLSNSFSRLFRTVVHKTNLYTRAWFTYTVSIMIRVRTRMVQSNVPRGDYKHCDAWSVFSSMRATVLFPEKRGRKSSPLAMSASPLSRAPTVIFGVLVLFLYSFGRFSSSNVIIFFVAVVVLSGLNVRTIKWYRFVARAICDVRDSGYLVYVLVIFMPKSIGSVKSLVRVSGRHEMLSRRYNTWTGNDKHYVKTVLVTFVNGAMQPIIVDE